MVEHSVAIISKLKERNSEGKYGFNVVSHVKVTQEQIEEWVLNEFLENNSMLDDNRIYYAELEETKNY